MDDLSPPAALGAQERELVELPRLGSYRSPAWQQSFSPLRSTRAKGIGSTAPAESARPGAWSPTPARALFAVGLLRYIIGLLLLHPLQLLRLGAHVIQLPPGLRRLIGRIGYSPGERKLCRERDRGQTHDQHQQLAQLHGWTITPRIAPRNGIAMRRAEVSLEDAVSGSPNPIQSNGAGRKSRTFPTNGRGVAGQAA